MSYMQWDSCTKPDKRSSPCGFAFATSSKSDSRRTATCKRRIRWTKDLNETFAMIVNRLGGPESKFTKKLIVFVTKCFFFKKRNRT